MTHPYPPMDSIVVADLLRRAGFAVDEARIQIDSRKGRTVAHLGYGHIAWFPENLRGRRDIEQERRILRLIEKQCSFAAPRVIYEDSGGWDVRAIVSGMAGENFLEQVRRDSHLARRTGRSLGRILVEQHTGIRASELDGWLTRAP